MKVVFADTRVVSTGHSPEDRHREELIELLRLNQPDWELFLHTPERGMQSLVGGPIEVEPWNLEGLKALSSLHRDLPTMANQIGADIILSLYGGSPLRSPVPVISYMADHEQGGVRSLIHRVALAAGQAGVGGSAARFAYRDSRPSFTGEKKTDLLEPWVSARFQASLEPSDQVTLDAVGLPPGYALAFGFTPNEYPFLMAAWSWVIGSTGDSVPLVVLGMGETEVDSLLHQARSMALGKTVSPLITPGLDALPVIYRQAGLFVYGTQRLSQQALRWALASGLPIAAQDVPITASILGDAGYLTPEGDSRLFGAAMLSILVEETLATRLRDRAIARYGGYRPTQAIRDLIDRLRDLS